MRYRRLASPLHAARAAAGGGFCSALVVAVLSTHHPVVLLALGVVVVGAGAGAGAGDALRRAARLGVPLALLVALINPLVGRDGLTVFAELGALPPFGQVDLTVEALVYGALDGLRVLLVVLACALFSAAVDPDELLRLLRRVSFRSALTAVLALRLVPVLARDARRLEEARRCRPDAGGGARPAARLAVLRAVTTGALDRAIDVAATLEVRGYGAPAPSVDVARRERSAAGRGMRAVQRAVGGLCPERGLAGSGRGRAPSLGGSGREPLSRHDLAFSAAALTLIGLSVAAPRLGVAGFTAYPRLVVAAGPAELLFVVLLVLVGLLPFCDRRGIAR